MSFSLVVGTTNGNPKIENVLQEKGCPCFLDSLSLSCFMYAIGTGESSRVRWRSIGKRGGLEQGNCCFHFCFAEATCEGFFGRINAQFFDLCLLFEMHQIC